MFSQTPQRDQLLALNREELILLANALNEVLHGIDVQESQTRLRCSREDAVRLFRKLTDLPVE